MRLPAAAFLLAACSSESPPTTPGACGDAGDGVIAGISRGACFGACPVYDLDVKQDGTLLYHGDLYVDQVGDRTGSIDAATVRRLQQAYLDADFYGFDDEYPTSTQDLPSFELRFLCGGQAKTVFAVGGDPGTPPELDRLADDFDAMVNSAQFTGQ